MSELAIFLGVGLFTVFSLVMLYIVSELPDNDDFY